GWHAAFDPGGNHFGFIFARECPRNGLLRQRGRDPAGAKVAQHAGSAETVAFHPECSEHFGEALIVEVPDLAEPGNYGIDVAYFLRAAAEFGAEFFGRIRAG